jgi:hypothetical protein
MAWRIKAWEAGKQASSETEFNEGESANKQEDPPVEIDPFLALFGGDWQPRIIFPGPQTSRAPSWGGSPYGAQVQLGWGQHPTHPTAMPFRPPTTKPTTASRGGARAGGNPTAQHGQGLPAAAQQSLDIWAFMATMLWAQMDSQLVIAAASHTNMVAFHTATAQASAASGGKDARMTVAKTSILRTCTRQVLAISFITLQVYKEMETEGATSEAVARILRRLLQPVQNTLNKLNILVTPHLVLTVKNLSFSANGNKTHSGCTKGIIIFAVPWKTQDVMNKEEEEEQCYNSSTLKTVADVRKHVSGGKVEPPATLLGLIRLFNNYCHLLDVLFGPHCPHLVYTREISNTLDYNEADLETRITQKLCLHLLWQVHHDARQFFLSWEQWSSLAPALRSNLAATVIRLVDDCTIDVMLT